MKDLLTTAASIIIILFCFSLLFLSEEKEISPEESVQVDNQNTKVKTGFTPPVKTTLFTRVQSVKVKNGVLMFTILAQGKLKEHYFLIRDKNLILIKGSKSDMPYESIKFEDTGQGTMRVTIPATFEIDFMQDLCAS